MDYGRDHGTWPDPVTAERLLRVVGAEDFPAGFDVLQDVADTRFSALLRLLTAASRGAEVDPEREQAALIAFRAARRGGRARRGRRLVMPGRSAKALAGGLAAVFAVSGVTVAAGAGVLPGPFRGGAFHAGPLTSGAAGPDEGAVGSPTAVPAATFPPPSGLSPAPGGDIPRGTAPRSADDGAGRGRGDPRLPHHPGVPTSSDRNHQAVVRALCRSYTQATRYGGHADPWLVARLEREAGRKDRIAAYCRRLLTYGPEGADVPTNPVPSATTRPPATSEPARSVSPVPSPSLPTATATAMPMPTATSTPTPTASTTAPDTTTATATVTTPVTPPAPQRERRDEDGLNTAQGGATAVR
jgi:hypothetical protein